MSALAFDFSYDEVAHAPKPSRRLYAVRGSVDATHAPVRTLDDLLGGAWASLTAGRDATCPVCAGTMRSRYSPEAGIAGGPCDGCGSSLD
jgi:hypothetical protein